MLKISHQQLKQIGVTLRKKRKKLNKSMKYFVDDVLSEPTISRIENGKTIAVLEKYEYYSKKLGFDFNELLESGSDIVQLNRIRSKLDSIEEDIEDRFFNEASGALNQINVDTLQYYKPYYHYLKGKLFIYQDQLDQGEVELLSAIKFSKTLPEESFKENILPCAYYAISNIYYNKNDIKTALESTEMALDTFVEDGERKEYLYKILLNKAAYLLKLDRLNETKPIADEIGSAIYEIEDQVVKTGYYELKALINKQCHKYEEAIEYIQEGLRIARSNKLFDRTFELRTLLGNIYSEIDRVDEAEHAYQRAILMSDRVDERIIPMTHTLLGHLYLKQNLFNQAKKHFDKAIKICESSNFFDSRYVSALYGSGVLLERLGDKMAAINNLEKALEISQHLELREKEQDISLMLISCYEGVNDEKHQKYLKLLPKICMKLKENNYVQIF